MRNWFVYVIRCKDNSLYTGITTDPERRLLQHQGQLASGAKALRGKGPLTLVWQHSVNDRGTASRLEYRIKQLRKQDKERLIRTGDLSCITG